jgi:hypothetical protein
MKKLIAGLGLLVMVGCGGATNGASAAEECAGFRACTEQSSAEIDCINDECACVSNHPGENRATTCPAALAGK